jgi:hypothetical protein
LVSAVIVLPSPFYSRFLRPSCAAGEENPRKTTAQAPKPGEQPRKIAEKALAPRKGRTSRTRSQTSLVRTIVALDSQSHLTRTAILQSRPSHNLEKKLVYVVQIDQRRRTLTPR